MRDKRYLSLWSLASKVWTNKIFFWIGNCSQLQKCKTTVVHKKVQKLKELQKMAPQIVRASNNLLQQASNQKCAANLIATRAKWVQLNLNFNITFVCV